MRIDALNIATRMFSHNSRNAWKTGGVSTLAGGDPDLVSTFVSPIQKYFKAEQFVTRNWIRNSPGNETRNEIIYETVSFLCLAQFVVLGISDTKLGYETPMWVFVGTFISEFRIRTSFPPIQN
jgi:hypothetical protein